jgi:hypothetical protein
VLRPPPPLHIEGATCSHYAMLPLTHNIHPGSIAIANGCMCLGRPPELGRGNSTHATGVSSLSELQCWCSIHQPRRTRRVVELRVVVLNPPQPSIARVTALANHRPLARAACAPLRETSAQVHRGSVFDANGCGMSAEIPAHRVGEVQEGDRHARARLCVREGVQG